MGNIAFNVSNALYIIHYVCALYSFNHLYVPSTACYHFYLIINVVCTISVMYPVQSVLSLIMYLVQSVASLSSITCTMCIISYIPCLALPSLIMYLKESASSVLYPIQPIPSLIMYPKRYVPFLSHVFCTFCTTSIMYPV